MRRGFTLVEMMISSGISVLVIGGVLGAFVGVQRMTKTAMAEAELSIGMRQLREKLLFHAAPQHDGKMWSGIISGISLAGTEVESDVKIRMESSWGYDLINSKAVSQNIELVKSTSTSSSGDVINRFVNDGDRYDDQWSMPWLVPGNYSWLPDEDFIVVTELSKRHVFYVNLESTVSGVTRRERVVVPVFGKAQRTLAGKVFDD